MIHIVFQHADVATLRQAIEADEKLIGDILEIKDDFAVGPLKNLENDEEWNARGDWWKSMLDASPYAKESLVGSFDDRKTVNELKERLSETAIEEAWIWMGQNQHDVCGYYWLIPQLKEFQGRVSVLYLNNLPFINDKGQIFYPTTIHEISTKELLKAKRLNRKVTSSEFEIDSDEWKKMADDNSVIRILEGGKKIAGKSEDFYDKDILSSLTGEWQKGNRAMQNILSKMKIKTGDVFLLWRMDKLAEDGKIEINGSPVNGWKEFEVKLKSAAPETTEVNTQPI